MGVQGDKRGFLFALGSGLLLLKLQIEHQTRTHLRQR